MPGEKKKIFSDIGAGVAIGVGTVVILAALSLAYGLWPRLWAWLQSGEGEVAHRVVYLLTVFLVLYCVITPRRPLPIRVTPVLETGGYALLTVRNLGLSGSNFYATAEVVGVRQPGVEGGFRRLTLRPTWGIRGFSSETIARDETGDLVLAWSTQDSHLGYDDRKTVYVRLTDSGQKGEVFHYIKGRSGGIEIDLGITISRSEPTVVPSSASSSPLLRGTVYGQR